MRRFVVLISVLALMLVMTSAVSATVKPAIKGSGVAENENAGFGPGITGEGGFNADHKDGVDKGKVKFKTLDGDVILSELQGRVVCYEWTTGVPSGGQGWEIRFQVISSGGLYPVPVGAYGSIYVQDNGKTGDMIDETFDNLYDSSCGQSDGSVTWEPMLEGGIKIK